MTRLTRMIVPLSLLGLLWGGIFVACHHSASGEAPAAPRPDPVAPGGQPASGLGPSDHVGSGALIDAGTDAVTPTPTPPPGSSASADIPGVRRGHAPGVRVVAQSATPPGAPPSGARSPGAQSPGAQPPGAQPPGAPSTGAQSPGASQPGPGSPSPGMGSGSAAPGAPGGTSAPADAGVSDSYAPPVRPMSDARTANDAQVTPILQRD